VLVIVKDIDEKKRFCQARRNRFFSSMDYRTIYAQFENAKERALKRIHPSSHSVLERCMDDMMMLTFAVSALERQYPELGPKQLDLTLHNFATSIMAYVPGQTDILDTLQQMFVYFEEQSHCSGFSVQPDHMPELTLLVATLQKQIKAFSKYAIYLVLYVVDLQTTCKTMNAP
jgi:hypothetical protein